MKLVCVLLASTALLAATGRGLPARPTPADYPAHASSQGVTIAAEIMDPDLVKGSFSTDLDNYTVVEVAVYPGKDGKPIELSLIDFALRVDGRMVRPVPPRSIAKLNQKRGQDRSRDITLYPSVGVHAGSWGTGTTVGVGVGVGGNAPGPASSDRDREVMEQELDDKALQEAVLSKPVAGYLYFPATPRRKGPVTYELEYQLGGVSIKLPVPKK